MYIEVIVGLSLATLILGFLLWGAKSEMSELESHLAESKTRLSEAEKDLLSSSQAVENLRSNTANLQAALKAHNIVAESLANQLVNDSLKFICSGVTSNNYETCVKKADKLFAVLRKNNVDFPQEDEKQFYNKIREVFEAEVKKDEAKQEQQLIKERIREEQQAERERQQEIEKLTHQAEAIELALRKARAQLKEEHSQEIEELMRQLAEAQAKTERAKSQAQLTRSGFVYVISNIGSLGEDVLKVGMTRRLDPMDRVHELSDASVPFPFDVHMMISCQDAPALESNLHKELNNFRVNKVNLRKEFFKVSLDMIVQLVERHHGKVEYRATAEAFEYNETKLITEKNETPKYDAAQETPDEKEAA